MMKRSVSVIIPVYNVAQYLPACLGSVLSQTLDNVEIICINDSSTDSSRETLAAYSERDNRIVVLDHDQNRGLAAARNTGLDFCSGEYVFFLDSDDILYSEDSLARLYAIAVRDDADEVVGATLRWYEQTGEQVYDYHKDYLLENLAAVRFADFPLLRHNAIACNKLLRHSFLEEHGLRFNNDLRKFEDNVFSWKAHLLAGSISLTLEPTYLHRLRSGNREKSIMQYKEGDPENHVRAVGYMLDFLKSNSRFEALRHHFDRYFFTWCYLDIQELAGRNPTDRQKIELLKMYLPVLVQVPTASLAENIMPGRYRKGLQLMQQDQFEEAWQVFVVKNFQAHCQQDAVAGPPGPRSSTPSKFLGKLNGLLKKNHRMTRAMVSLHFSMIFFRLCYEREWSNISVQGTFAFLTRTSPGHLSSLCIFRSTLRGAFEDTKRLLIYICHRNSVYSFMFACKLFHQPVPARKQ